MLLSKIKTVDDEVIEMVAQTPMSIRDLHQQLRSRVTLRAVYKAVDQLLRAEVVVKAGKHILLNQEWLQRLEGLFYSARPIQLANGEKAAYNFNSIDHLDAFWKTLVLPLERDIGAAEIFFYNPHNFWAYLPSRKESEDAYYRHFGSTTQSGFFTLGGTTPADLEFKRSYQSEYFQVDVRPLAECRRTDHLTILGPFIITARLGKGLADRIDTVYASGSSIKDILPEIVRLCEKPGKTKFLIEHNQVRAARLRKLLARNFYFKRPE